MYNVTSNCLFSIVRMYVSVSTFHVLHIHTCTHVPLVMVNCAVGVKSFTAGSRALSVTIRCPYVFDTGNSLHDLFIPAESCTSSDATTSDKIHMENMNY